MLQQLNQILNQHPLKAWRSEDFSGIDQLHLGGRPATEELAAWLPNTAKIGLDIGCGLGGTSRYLAQLHDCKMTGLDLNDAYIKAAVLLNQCLPKQPNCQFVVGNSLTLPFEDERFDFVVSQHATMNITAKSELLNGLHRVLKLGACVLLHEVMLQDDITADQVTYPTPWASTNTHSHLCTWKAFETLAKAAGFSVMRFEDTTSAALDWIHQARTVGQHRPKSPFTAKLALGHAAGVMSANVLDNITRQRLQIISAMLVKL